MRAKIQRVCSTMLTAMLLAACGPAQEPEPAEPPPVKDAAFGDMVGTMDEARGVEDTLQQQKQAADRAIDEAEGQSDQ